MGGLRFVKKGWMILAIVWGTCCQASPEMAIIIDDLGLNLSSGKEVIELPGPVDCAIIPRTPFASTLSQMAHLHQKEILMHLPMEPLDPSKIDPHSLKRQMNRDEMIEIFRKDLISLNYVDGVNNHKGSALTESTKHMDWLMREIKRLQMFFVDSRTINDSVADTEALAFEVPSTHRNIFLDHIIDAHLIEKQFQQALAHAREYGTVVVIGHPYPETLSFLEKTLPTLSKENIQLVPVSEIIKQQQMMNDT